ncbi:PucC family protein, partial [Sandarakinorhabdus sp.]|uniref:PucC family protein n=1 Tax=Sandarakinorhabdus sp. TaxID=1916663 RepID=UPI00286DA345
GLLVEPFQGRRNVVGLGAAGFGLQDVLLEPYGGQVLGLSVGATTGLTAFSSLGTLLGLGFCARILARGGDPARLAGLGAVIGISAFSAVIFSAPLSSIALLCLGAAGIGLGSGLFGVATLTAAMTAAPMGQSGIALGAWGAVQATATGFGIIASGAIRDGVGALAMAGTLGPGLTLPSTGYSMVWHIEILLLFLSLVALGPLARRARDAYSNRRPEPVSFGLAEFPT